MAKKTVEQELVEATGVKPKAKEKRQDYLKRLHGAASDLDDDAWKGLSTPAQKWVNESTKLDDADEALVDFEGAAAPAEAPKAKGKAKAVAAEDEEGDAEEDEAADETEADEPEGEGEEEDTDVKATPKKKAAKAVAKEAPTPAKKKAAPAAEAKPKGKKSSGGVQAVMNYVLKNPDDSVADVVKALKADGITVTPSTASSARGFFKICVKFLQAKKLTTKVIFKD